MLTLLYASRAQIGPDEDWSLFAQAAGRNSALGVTGALFTCGTYFAEVLEGDDATVEALMRSIAAEPRHADARLLLREQIAARRFNRFHILPCDHSTFARRAVERARAASPDDRDQAARRLNRLLQALAWARTAPMAA